MSPRALRLVDLRGRLRHWLALAGAGVGLAAIAAVPFVVTVVASS